MFAQTVKSYERAAVRNARWAPWVGRVIFAVAVTAAAFGCQSTQVQRKVNQLVSTIPDVYYGQVLDNIARIEASPASMPYFGTPSQGTNLNQRQLQLTYTPGWDFITAGTAFLGRYLFDKQTSALEGQIENQQSIQLQPITDPDKLLYMQYAYRKLIGDRTLNLAQLESLHHFFETHRSGATDYYRAITGVPLECASFPPKPEKGCCQQPPQLDCASCRACWLVVSGEHKGIPHDACYMSHYGRIWVYVPEENSEQLTQFTLAILDIATAAATTTKPLQVELVTPNAEAVHGAAEELPSLIPRERPNVIPGPPVSQ